MVDTAKGRDLGESTAPVAPEQMQPAGPIELVDATATANLDAVRSGGNTHGVGIAFVDVTGDDFADIVVVAGRSNVTSTQYASSLLRNRGDGTFEDISESSGLAALLAGVDGYSIATGDLDEDGDLDLYIGAQPNDRLLLNNGDGTFVDATQQRGAGGPASDPSLVGNGKSKVVSIADYDNDGLLDIVSASSTLPRPGAYLLRNLGGGNFEDISVQSGVTTAPTGNPCAVLWSDYDNDGDRDLWIWNDRGGHVLLRNDNGEALIDVTADAKLDAIAITSPMGIAAADIDHDGDLDYYVSNIGNNPLLRNNGNGTFVDITTSAGTGGRYGWGLGFVDFDLDGWADLFVAQEDDRPNLVFRNQRDSTFSTIEVPHPAVLHERAAHNVAVAFADYDHDGRVDVVTARTDGSNITLYRNQTVVGTNGWIQVRLAATSQLLAGGLGARIALATGEGNRESVQFTDIAGGGSRASQNELGAQFGLGAYRGAKWIAVLWPTGAQTVVRNVAAGQRLELAP